MRPSPVMTIGPAQVASELGLAGKQLESRLQRAPRNASKPNPSPPAAPAPGSRAKSCLRTAGGPLAPSGRGNGRPGENPAAASPFAARNSSGPSGAEQAVFDVDGHAQFLEPAAAARGAQARQPCPGRSIARRGQPTAVQKFPAQGAGEAETTVIRRAATDAGKAAFCARGAASAGMMAPRPAVSRAKGWKRLGGSIARPTILGRFDDGGAGLRLPPPLGGTGTMGGIDGGDSLEFSVEQAADDLAEAVAAVAHRQQCEMVLGTPLPPTARHGFCRGAGTESALELIGDNEDRTQDTGYSLGSFLGMTGRNRRRKALPPPTSLLSSTLPPMRSTDHFTIASPKPAPPSVRERALSTR